MDPFIGEIKAVAFNYAPVGWLLCDGSIFKIEDYPALFALLGPTYGGNGTTTFGLPDLRGRTLIGVGTGPGLTNRFWGEMVGYERVSLSLSEMPEHNHLATAEGSGEAVLSAAAGNADSGDPAGRSLATNPKAGSFGANIYKDETPTVPMQPLEVTLNDLAVNVGDSGASESHKNMQPSLAVYYIIAHEGVFPPRN